MVYNYFYKITNIVNNKFYYGVHKTNNLNDSYLGSGKALGLAKKKYGKENFIKEILQFFDTYEECLAHETLIVDEDMVKDRMCYNMRTGGQSGIGWKHSDEAKSKNREASTGKVISEETKAKIRASLKGRNHTEEAKARMSASRKGRKLTEEHRANMIASRIGQKRSEETKAKMSASRKRVIYNKQNAINQ